MKHNWISILATAVLLLGACGRQYSPVEQAVIDHVQAQVGADSKLMVTRIAVEDSLTYGQLLEQRIKAFEVKYQQDNKFLEKSVAKNNIKKINQRVRVNQPHPSSPPRPRRTIRPKSLRCGFHTSRIPLNSTLCYIACNFCTAQPAQRQQSGISQQRQAS
jgi:hypothetical protein